MRVNSIFRVTFVSGVGYRSSACFADRDSSCRGPEHGQLVTGQLLKGQDHHQYLVRRWPNHTQLPD